MANKHKPTKRELRYALKVSMGDWSFKRKPDHKKAAADLAAAEHAAVKRCSKCKKARAAHDKMQRAHVKLIKGLQAEHAALSSELLVDGPSVDLARRVVAFQKRLGDAR